MLKTFLILFFNAIILFSQGINTTFYGSFKGRGNSNYSSCYGFTAQNGREYAILGCYTGTSIIDLTDKPIKEVSFIPGPNSMWREMKVYKNYAYVVTEGAGAGYGLQIIDLLKPDSAKLVNTFLPNINGRSIVTSHTVSIEGKYLYLNGSKPGTGGVIVLDLTDPVNPITLGEYSGLYVHDCSIYNDTIYAAGIYGEGLDIIDAKNKNDLKRIKLVTYPGAGTHNTDLTSDKNFILTTDEIGSQNILRIWDRTDFGNIELVATYHAKPNTIIHNVHVKGKFAFIAHYSEGLRIVDLANPKIPVEVASYDTYAGSVNNYVGAWGAFPYFSSNKILISDMSSGLVVVEFDQSKSKAFRGIVTLIDSVTNLPIADAKVEVLENSSILFSNSKGEVPLGFTSDTINIKISKSNYWSGYETKIQKIILNSELTSKINVKIKPFKTGSVSGKILSKTNNEPIKNISLKISNTPLSSVSDSNGVFRFNYLLADSSYTIVVANFGFNLDSVTLKIKSDSIQIYNFNLHPNTYQDNFEYNFGWSVGSSNDSGNYGVWARSVANSYLYLGAMAQPSNHSTLGSYALITGGANNSSSQNVDGKTTITSPLITGFKNYDAPILNYWRWFFTSNSTTGNDSLIVQASNDNGVYWQNLEVVTKNENNWIEKKIYLWEKIQITDKMKIRFIAIDRSPSSIVEAAIDDFNIYPTLMGLKDDLNIPKSFKLYQNYPNPFNNETIISFQIPNRNFVSLKIFNLLGNEVAKLINEDKDAGKYDFKFNASKLSSGIYFYKLQFENKIEMKKFMLLK